MKKIIAMLLAVIMCLGMFVACGEDKTPASSTPGAIATEGKKINTEVAMATIGEASVKTEPNIPDGAARVIGITIADSSKVLSVVRGTTAKIEFTVKPEAAHDKSVYYKVENEKIAKVDKDGNVLGLDCGSTTIDVITNDNGFKRTIQVVVFQNAGDAAKSKEMLDLINAAREANGKEAFATDDVALSAAANQRALEEAIDMVNNKQKAMDNTRLDNKGSIFADFDIWSKSSAQLYVWGDYSKDTKAAYDALVATKNADGKLANALALGIREPEEGEKEIVCDTAAIGYFVFNDVTYWCILLSAK